MDDAGLEGRFSSCRSRGGSPGTGDVDGGLRRLERDGGSLGETRRGDEESSVERDRAGGSEEVHRRSIASADGERTLSEHAASARLRVPIEQRSPGSEARAETTAGSSGPNLLCGYRCAGLQGSRG